MTPTLTRAVEAVERLPQARQGELADAILEATRASIDEAIAAGEASSAAYGGKSPAEVFERLLAKHEYEVLIPPQR